jgi:hypothetical protein
MYLPFSGFNPCAQIVQRDRFAIHLYPAAEDEAVQLIALVAD